MRRIVALFVLAMTLATGCSLTKTSPRPVSTTEENPAGPATIKLGLVTGIQNPELDAVVAAFQDKFPAYRVETVRLPADQAAVTRAVTNGEVDLIPGANFYAWQPEINGAMADLSPYLRTPGISTSHLDWFLDGMRSQGIVELPYAVVPTAVVYNRDLARNAGVTIPETGWTWDQFRDTAKRLTRQDGDSRTWGFHTDQLIVPVAVWVKQAGGPPSNRPSTDSLPDALQYFSNLIYVDRSAAPPRKSLGEKLEDLFANGKAAMTITILPDANGGQTLPFEWGFAPIPSQPGARPVLFVWARTVAMSKNAPNRDAAWQFLKYLIGPDAAMVLAAAGELPCYPAEEAKLTWLQGKPGLPKSIKSLLDAQWIGLYSFPKAGVDRDGLLIGATLNAFESATSWQSAAAEYAKQARASGLK